MSNFIKDYDYTLDEQNEMETMLTQEEGQVKTDLAKEKGYIMTEIRDANHNYINSLDVSTKRLMIEKGLLLTGDAKTHLDAYMSRVWGISLDTINGRDDDKIAQLDPGFYIALCQAFAVSCCESLQTLDKLTDGAFKRLHGHPVDGYLGPNTTLAFLAVFNGNFPDSKFNGLLSDISNDGKTLLSFLLGADIVVDTNATTTVEEVEEPVTKVEIEETKVTEQIAEFTKNKGLTENSDGSYTVDTKDNAQKIFNSINTWNTAKLSNIQKEKVENIKKACETVGAKPEMMKVTKKVDTKNAPKAKVEIKTKLSAKEVVPAANCAEFIKNSDGLLKLSGTFATFDKTKTPRVMTKDASGEDVSDPENVTTITIGKLNFLLYGGDLMTESGESIEYKNGDKYYSFNAGEGNGSTVFAYKTDALCIGTKGSMLGKDGGPISFKGKTEFGEIKEGTNNANGTTDTKDDFPNIMIDGVQYVPTSPYLAGLDEEAPSIEGMEATAMDRSASQKVIDDLNIEIDDLHGKLASYTTGTFDADKSLRTKIDTLDLVGMDYWIRSEQTASEDGLYAKIKDILDNAGIALPSSDIDGFFAMIKGTTFTYSDGSTGTIEYYDGDDPDDARTQALNKSLETNIPAFIKAKTDALQDQMKEKQEALDSEVIKVRDKEQTFDQMQPLGSIPDCQSIAFKDARTLLITKTDGKTQEIVTTTNFSIVDEKATPLVYTMDTDYDYKNYVNRADISFSLNGTNLELRIPYTIIYATDKKLETNSNAIGNVRLVANPNGTMTVIYDDATTATTSLSGELETLPHDPIIETKIKEIADDETYDGSGLFHAVNRLFDISPAEKLHLKALALWSSDAVLDYVDEEYRPAVMKKCAEMVEAKTITVDELQTSMTHYLGEIADLDSDWSALSKAEITAYGEFADTKYEGTAEHSDHRGAFVTPVYLSGDDAADKAEQTRYETEKAANGLTWFQRFVYRQEFMNGIPGFKDWMKDKLTSYSAELKKLEKAPVAVEGEEEEEEDEEAKKKAEEEAKKKAEEEAKKKAEEEAKKKADEEAKKKGKGKSGSY